MEHKTTEMLAQEAEAKKLEDAAERQWRTGRQNARAREDSETGVADNADDSLAQMGSATAGQPAAAAVGRAPRAGMRQRGQVGIALADDEYDDQPSQQGAAARSGTLRAGQGATAPVISLWGEQDTTSSAAPTGQPFGQSSGLSSGQTDRKGENGSPKISPVGTPIPPLLDPLARGKSAGGPFGGKSSLGDMLSIVKFTWKQAFRK